MSAYYKPEEGVTVFNVGRLLVMIPDQMTIANIQYCLRDKTMLALTSSNYKPLSSYLPNAQTVKDNNRLDKDWVG